MTLEQAQAQLAALNCAIAENPSGLASVSVNGRSVSFRTLAEQAEHINWLTRYIAGQQRIAAGGPSHGYSLADFTGSR